MNPMKATVTEPEEVDRPQITVDANHTPAHPPSAELHTRNGSPPAPVTSSPRMALSGGAWTIGGYLANQILRFGFNLILTRLLAPEVFGDFSGG